MAYRLILTRDAQRSLTRINRPDQERVARTIDTLAVDPHPPDAKTLQGSEGLLRVRVGDYRIVYCVLGETSKETAEETVGAPGNEVSEDRHGAAETTGVTSLPPEQVAEQTPEVRIIRIGHRRDVYRRPLRRPDA